MLLKSFSFSLSGTTGASFDSTHVGTTATVYPAALGAGGDKAYLAAPPWTPDRSHFYLSFLPVPFPGRRVGSFFKQSLPQAHPVHYVCFLTQAYMHTFMVGGESSLA